MLRFCVLILLVCGLVRAESPRLLVMGDGREPAFSGDGRFVVCRADGDNGEPELYRIEVKGGAIKRLGVAGTSPIGFPGESDMLFLGTGIFPELYRLDTRTWEAVSLPVPAPPSGAPFPAGKRLIAYPAGYEEPAPLVFFDLASSKQVSAVPGLPAGTVKLSADGRYAAIQTRIQGVCNLEVRDLKNGKSVFKTDARAGSMQINGCHSPDFSPDGRFLVYVSGDIQPLADLMLLELESGKIEKLTTDGADNQSPRFSPDGRSLVFASCRDGRYRICLMPFPK